MQEFYGLAHFLALAEQGRKEYFKNWENWPLPLPKHKRFELQQFSRKMTSSERRAMKRNVKYSVPRSWAVQQARTYWGTWLPSGEGKCVQSRYAKMMYLQWSQAIQFGYGEIDGVLIEVYQDSEKSVAA